MKLLTALQTFALLTASAFAATENFDSLKLGDLPAGWVGGVTGQGTHKWSIVKDASAPSQANALKQSGEGAYPWCVKQGTSLKDGFVEVKFKPLSGEDDQAGGVVWRAKDGDNYYVARANALEGNVRIYHFVNGKRTQFKGVNLAVAAQQWHTLRVTFSGPRFTVLFNGKELFTAEDETHKDAGKVGIWTKADSVTLFDDFSFGGQ